MNKSILTFCLIFLVKQLIAQELNRYEFEHQQMGTQFRIILYAGNPNLAQNIANQCFKKVDKLNTIFSDYDPKSEISRLSATAGSGKKVKVSQELWQIIKQSKRYSKKSNGAFDLTIGPLSKLWRSMIRRKEIFNGVKINIAKSRVGYKKICLYPLSKRVKLAQKEMRLDAGGIAKGYTVDQLASHIKKQGVSQFLVDGGGDIFVGNAPPNKAGWEVKIKIESENGEKKEELLALENIAIASSGDTYRFLEWEGKRYSHIIDPRTGYGVENQKLVTVLAASCMEADAVASILSVLQGPETSSFLKKRKKIKVF